MAEAVLKYHCAACAKNRENGRWEIHLDGKRIAAVDWVNDSAPDELPRLNAGRTEALAKALAKGLQTDG